MSVTARSYIKEEFDGPDGQLLEPTTGIVSDLNVLYPTQEGAKLWLAGLAKGYWPFSADGFGYLETMFTWKDRVLSQ